MRIIQGISRWIVKNAMTAQDYSQWSSLGLLGSQTYSGISINNDNALTVSTVFACLRAISEDVAKLPFKLYKETGTNKEIITDHPISDLIKRRPNNRMTSMVWRETMTAHAIGWGNAYSVIFRNAIGEPEMLVPLRPDRVAVKTNGNQFLYEYTDNNGNKKVYTPYNILHIHGLGSDGVIGYNVIQYARECIGSAKATEKFGAKLFGNGAAPNLVLKYPNKLSDPAFNRLRESVNGAYSGDKAHSTLILEEGADFSKNTFSPDEAQFLQTKQFSVAEICRWFRMPPHKVADTTRAQGWSTIEQTNIDYVTDTLMPWLTRWEQAIEFSLLTEEEKQDGYFVKHNVDALLRGDTVSRYNAYAIGRQWGWLSVNDIRSREDMNPIEDGDEYLVPLNMGKSGEISGGGNNIERSPRKDEEEESADDQDLIEDASARIANAQIREIERHINKKIFSQWLETFYAKHIEYVRKTIKTITNKDIAADLVQSVRYKADGDFKQFQLEIKDKVKEFINANS